MKHCPLISSLSIKINIKAKMFHRRFLSSSLSAKIKESTAILGLEIVAYKRYCKAVESFKNGRLEICEEEVNLHQIEKQICFGKVEKLIKKTQDELKHIDKLTDNYQPMRNYAIPSKISSSSKISILKNMHFNKKRLIYNGYNYVCNLRYASVFVDYENEITKTKDELISSNDSNTRNATLIQEILKSNENESVIKLALSRCIHSVDEDLVVKVLQRHRSDWKLAFLFFNWASNHINYCHKSSAYNEMLDILGRMKQVRLMQQVFDSIPKEKCALFIDDKTFAILMNRYASAHKVQEAIDSFYKRKDYGFELNLTGFQTLLMSLCRFKHVEEAEALFRKKQNEFLPVIKSRNIILNGWCVLGNLREAKRFWNDIISSKCKPDPYTYSIFINSLTKSGKLGTAVKLFTSMWEKGLDPHVPICNNIIDQLCFKKRIPEALEIFEEMNERGCMPDVVTYNSLIKHLCKIERMEKVYELLNDMEKKNCMPNCRTYSYLLKTSKKPEDVSDLIMRMKRTGCKIDSDTYNLILNLFVGWKYQKGVKLVWDEMEKNGLGPDQRSYTIVIHGLHKEERFDEALVYYNKMRMKGMTPEPRTRLLVKAIYLKREENSEIFVNQVI